MYNPGKSLKKCITSILKQSFRQILLILVDDGSTDGSSGVCDEFAQKDCRVTVIHQKNKGSVEARKTGVFSPQAQAAKYIFICDADDTISMDALETLYTLAELHNADCVCGRMQRLWKGIRFASRYQPPCFNITVPEVYSHEDIIQKLYVSCFGISNYPVSLVAKLYRTELITNAINFEPVVRFMGDDLSVTLRVMPETQKLVITPKVIYNYRIGGGTSKYMPYMMDDFLSLYEFKGKLAEKHPMPQEVKKLLDIELMNIVRSYLIMSARDGHLSEDGVHRETVAVCKKQPICEAAKHLAEIGCSHDISNAIVNGNYNLIENTVFSYIEANKYKTAIKRLLMSL